MVLRGSRGLIPQGRCSSGWYPDIFGETLHKWMTLGSH